ncbi:MAG: IS66 family transposase [Flavobacteriaceae bacterium]|nr:IS66 family transposase [Flavobacteriaceae bacterium]
MENDPKTLVSQLEKKNSFLQRTIQKSEKRVKQVEEKVKQVEQTNNQLEQQNKYLKFQIDQFKRMLFGAKRERFVSNDAVNQMILPFDIPAEPVLEPSVEKIEYSRKKATRENHHGRLELPSHLAVEEVVIEPKESTEGLRCIGQEITSTLDYVPAKLFVRKYIRNKYAMAEGQGILIGELPVRPIEKGIAEAGLLSNILVEKFVDHLPVYRQIERFKREQVSIPATTIDSWITQIADLIEPLYDHLTKLVLGQGYLQVDETPIKVLDHKNKKGKTHQGYYWVYNAPLQNAVFYDYNQGRGREGPMKLLKNFTGYLQTDGYSVYEWFAKMPGITQVACMAHVRRKFEQALDYDAPKAGWVMKKIQELYAIEDQAKQANLSVDQRKELRLAKSLQVLNELGKQIAAINKTTIPKSPMGIALNYAIQRWDKLLNYLYDGSLEIDNNQVENAIRPNALGRKNYLFAGSHEGAKRAAMFYSFFGTCKKNNVNPFQWLKKVLEVIPNYPANKIGELLPQNLKL